jgi:hypothetical protein
MLERVLGELPEVCGLGEVVHLWHRGLELNESCGCGEPFHDCPFWSEVGEVAFGGWDQISAGHVESLRQAVDRARLVPKMTARRLRPSWGVGLAEYMSYYNRLYAAAARVSGASVLLDSSKHPSLAFALSTQPDIDLRVLHMVRDPRAVAFSWAKTVSRPEATAGSEQQMWRRSVTESALQWTGHNVLVEGLRLTSTPVMRLRYEDFVAAPLDATRQVADFAGLSASSPMPVSAAGVADLTSAHTVSGNPARFATGQVPITARNEWLDGLTRGERRRVTTLTLPMVMGYHYPVAVRARG